MICIKCSNDTKVTNSRPHKKTPSVWRRRECKACGTVFTTSEVVADSTYQFIVTAANGSKTDFSLPRLMLSIVSSLSHRDGVAIADESYWLAQTVAQTIQATATDTITAEALAEETYGTLSFFDATAGLQYGARHGLIKNTAQRPRRGRPRTTRRAN
jgi:transcriptional regulator NrdR family protein